MDNRTANAAFVALYPRLTAAFRCHVWGTPDERSEAVQEALCLAFARIRSKVLRDGVPPPVSTVIAYTLRDVFAGVRFAGVPHGVASDAYGARIRRAPPRLRSLDDPVGPDREPGQSRHRVGHDVVAGDTGIEDRVLAGIDVGNAVASLTRSERRLLVTRFVDRVPLTDIAAGMRTSAPTACRRTRRLAAKVRGRLDGWGPGSRRAPA